MTSRIQRLGFLCSALLLALTLGDVASAAGSAKFMLTLTRQGAADEIRPGVFLTPTTQFKLTNKEMLILLSSVYPVASTPGAVLGFTNTGDFQILDQDGVLLQTVSGAVLDAVPIVPPVRSGTNDTNTGIEKWKSWSVVTVGMAIDPNHEFTLKGNITATATTTTLSSKGNYTLTVFGPGTHAGLDSFVAGKILIKLDD